MSEPKTKDVSKRKSVPSVLVDCRDCGTTFEVTQRTFDLAHKVSDGQFRCDTCTGEIYDER